MDNFGYIYKIYENKVIILTPTRGFITIKKREGLVLGHRVYFEEKDIINSRKIYYFASSVAAILLVSFICIRLLTGVGNVYGYVDVDINPSVDFAVDKNYMVLKAVAMNDDAKKVLISYDFNGKRLDDAISALLNKSEYYGYIKDSDKNIVIVSFALANNGNGNSISYAKEESRLDSFINNIKDLNEGNIIKKILKVPYDERDMALRNGISMGKYSMYLKAKERDKNITIEYAKNICNSKLLELEGVSLVPSNVQNEEKPDYSNKEKIMPQHDERSETDNLTSDHSEEKPPLEDLKKESNAQKVQGIENKATTTGTAVKEDEQTPGSNNEAKNSEAKNSGTAKIQYNFEKDSAENYSVSSGKLSILTNRHFDGKHSIMADVDYDGEITFNINHIAPGIAAGKTITFHVLTPPSNLKAVSPFMEDSSGKSYYNWKDASKLHAKFWNTITLKIPKDVQLPIKKLGLKFQTQGRLNAHIYIDAISWDEN